jgi:hypothetical protein
MPVREGAAAERQRGQVDQAVTRRHERRDVLEAVDVDAEPAGEDVLHDGRVEDDDAHLHPGGPALAAEQGDEEHPCARSQQALLGERGTGVQPEHEQHPRADDPRDAGVAGHRHPITVPPAPRPLSRGEDEPDAVVPLSARQPPDITIVTA